MSRAWVRSESILVNMETQTIAILFNPSSGKGRSLKEKKKIRRLLGTYGVPYQWFESRSETHLVELAAETAGKFLNIAGVGGDTTFNIIARELLASPHSHDITMGMLGTGSANDIVRGLGIHRLEDAIQAIKGRRVGKMDVGKLELVKNGKTRIFFFLGTISAGLGTTVNRFVEDYYRKRPLMAKINPFTQLWAGLKGIRHSFSTGRLPMAADVCQPGSQNPAATEFSLLVFLNTPYYANGLKLGSHNGMLDGRLECCTVHTTSFVETLGTAVKILKSSNINTGLLRVISAPHFVVLPEKAMDIQVDGDVIEEVERFNVSLQPGRLSVFAKQDILANQHSGDMS